MPIAGMGATYGGNGDAYPATVHAVSESVILIGDTYFPRHIMCSSDQHEYLGKPFEYGYQPSADAYRYWNEDAANPERWAKYTLRKNGYYIRQGNGANSTFAAMWVGFRNYRQNPHI